MKLIGYRRRILDGSSDVEAAFKALERNFGSEGFEMDLSTAKDMPQDVSFNIELGAKKLKSSNVLGFFKKSVVGVSMDNQAFRDPFFVYPHSMVQIETMEKSSSARLGKVEWLSLAKSVTATMELDLAFVMESKENTANYFRTPLGCGIGLIKIFWINCFGTAYSDLIPQKIGPSYFYKRENFGTGCKALVSASSYEEYQSILPQLLASQKCEIGEDLFNRLPAEKSGNGGAYSIVNLGNVLRFLSFFTGTV